MNMNLAHNYFSADTLAMSSGGSVSQSHSDNFIFDKCMIKSRDQLPFSKQPKLTTKLVLFTVQHSMHLRSA